MITKTLDLSSKYFSYPVYIGKNLLSNPPLLLQHIHGHQVLVVTQTKIAELYLPPLQEFLKNYHVDVFYLPDGEQFKNVTEWQNILNLLIENRHDRSTTIIALGGGVVGDIAGFAAACYLRGVNYLQIPTTLIAQVDAAIGGKTAINHAKSKNSIGAFHQPQCVIADINALTTLPERELKAGLAEVIKYGLIADAEFFSWLEKNDNQLLLRNSDALLHATSTSVALKAKIVMQDEYDQGLRNILNFGHTFGHALEVLGAYNELLHGEAVALGMVMATALSLELGLLAEPQAKRIFDFLGRFCFLDAYELPSDESIIKCMWRDKKVQYEKLNLVLLRNIGMAEKFTVSESEIKQGLLFFRERHIEC